MAYQAYLLHKLFLLRSILWLAHKDGANQDASWLAPSHQGKHCMFYIKKVPELKLHFGSFFTFHPILVSKHGPNIFLSICCLWQSGLSRMFPFFDSTHSEIKLIHPVMLQSMSQQEAEKIDGSTSKLQRDTDQNINLANREVYFIIIRNSKGFIHWVVTQRVKLNVFLLWNPQS